MANIFSRGEMRSNSPRLQLKFLKDHATSNEHERRLNYVLAVYQHSSYISLSLSSLPRPLYNSTEQPHLPPHCVFSVRNKPVWIISEQKYSWRRGISLCLNFGDCFPAENCFLRLLL